MDAAAASRRTLVVSDLHLGTRHGRARLGEPEARQALVAALAGCDRLVLLGDLLELREGPLRDALDAARPVLTELGRAMGDGSEVVVVPGNHDHYLLADWFHRRAADGPPGPLSLESSVAISADSPLGAVAGALASGGAEVRAAYPGVWLREDVYATHGHYLDRFTTVPILERLGVGATARVLRRSASDMRSIDDYEAVLAPVYAWIHAIAQTAGPAAAAGGGGISVRMWEALGRGARRGGVRERALRGLAAGGVRALNRAGLGPLRADLTPGELRRAGLQAISQVLLSLGVNPRYVLFGHTHRAGPLPGDHPAEWVAPGGSRLLNTGCWVHEPAFTGHRPRQSPYRAGFAVSLEGGDPGGAPQLVNLLDR